jgi:hypothetical protein
MIDFNKTPEPADHKPFPTTESRARVVLSKTSTAAKALSAEAVKFHKAGAPARAIGSVKKAEKKQSKADNAKRIAAEKAFRQTWKVRNLADENGIKPTYDASQKFGRFRVLWADEKTKPMAKLILQAYLGLWLKNGFRRFPRAVTLFLATVAIILPFMNFMPLVSVIAFVAWGLFWYKVKFVNVFGSDDTLLKIGSVPIKRPMVSSRRVNHLDGELNQIRHDLWDVASKTTLYVQVDPTKYIQVYERIPGVYLLVFDVIPPLTDEYLLRVMPPIVKTALRLNNVSELITDDTAGTRTLLASRINVLQDDIDEELVPIITSDATKLDPYLDIPIGVTNNGDEVALPMCGPEGTNRVVISGKTGGGKSGPVRTCLMTWAAAPHVRTVILDGKGTEFAMFKQFADCFVSFPEERAAGVDRFFNHIEAEKLRRQRILADHLFNSDLNDEERHTDTWNHFDDGYYLIIVIDELSTMFGGMTTGEYKDFQARLKDVLSIGRSIGIGAIISSQSLRSDLLDTGIRNGMIDYRLGFPTNDDMESGFLGFPNDATVAPHLIPSGVDKNGNKIGRGQFVPRGLETRNYCKSYFVSTKRIRRYLAELPVPEEKNPNEKAEHDAWVTN